jgi:hypothetical protein
LGRVTPVVETAKVDDAFLISDEEAVTVIYELLEHEGLCLGGSTGINVAGAIKLAKQLGPGKTIVTILADSGNRYQSKLFNPEFMRSKNLPVPAGWAKAPFAPCPPSINRDAVGGHASLCPPYGTFNAAGSGSKTASSARAVDWRRIPAAYLTRSPAPRP